MDKEKLIKDLINQIKRGANPVIEAKRDDKTTGYTA